MATDPESEIATSAAVAPQPFGTGEMAPGVVTVLSDRVRRIVAPNPTLMTGPGTNTYLIGSSSDRSASEGSAWVGDLIVIDPGPDMPEHLDRVAEVGAGRIRFVLYTHTHMDHSPGVAGLVERTGAVSVGFAPRTGHDDDPTPSTPAEDGFVVRVEGATLRALHTPGHASNHLCWLLEEEGMLFSGDHVMNGSTVVIAPPDGDMTDYLTQLERLRALGLRSIAPGHGTLITDPDAKLSEYLAHRQMRERQIAAELGPIGRTVDDIVTSVYVDLVDALRPVARYSVWAHLRRLARCERALTSDPDDMNGAWMSR